MTPSSLSLFISFFLYYYSIFLACSYVVIVPLNSIPHESHPSYLQERLEWLRGGMSTHMGELMSLQRRMADAMGVFKTNAAVF